MIGRDDDGVSSASDAVRRNSGADVEAAANVAALALLGENPSPGVAGIAWSSSDAITNALAASRNLLRKIEVSSESHTEAVLRSAAAIEAAVATLRKHEPTAAR